VEYALLVGRALNCEIAEESEFARKNYFYPDLPKGFQITQYDRPLAVQGSVEIEGDDGKERAIRITRVHLEEDPGRLVHVGSADHPRYALVDYNRSGVPLIEIVTEPDLRSPKEARRFLNILRATLEYLSVFDGEREGSLRVDANISLAGNERAEIKNISSYKGVEKALTYEITRQKNLVRRGQRVVRETRHFQEARGVTTSARSKEMEHDYRYFPEPDLRPLRVKDWALTLALPELPAARRTRCIRQYGISLDHARTLTGDLRLADFYEKIAHDDPLLAATWVADTLQGELNYRDLGIGSFSPDRVSDLLRLLKKKEITDRAGVEVLRVMLDECMQGIEVEFPSAIVQRLGLGKAAGSEFAQVLQEVVQEQPQAVQDYRSGKPTALNFLVGQAMKKTRGKADPRELTALLREIIGEGGR
jgi:aspartyl-tRNA(Asn)/glutamyl-tRNA(Gln) amidotransferase subunit B